MFDASVLHIQVTVWMLGVLSSGRAYDLTTVGPPSDLTIAHSCALLQLSGATKQPLMS